MASIDASSGSSFPSRFYNDHNGSESYVPITTYTYDLDPLIVISQNVNEKGLVVMSGQFNKPFTNSNILLSIKYQNAQGEWVTGWCKTLYSYNQYNETLKATFELPASANPTYNVKVELSSDSSTSNFSSVVWNKVVNHYKQLDYSAANCDLDENEYTVLLTPKKDGTLITDANGKVTGVKDRVTSAYSWNKLGNVLLNNKKSNVVFSPKNPATLFDSNGIKSIKMLNTGAVIDTLGSTPELIYDAVGGHPVPYLYSYNDPVYMVAGKFSITGLLLKFSQWPDDVNGPGYHDFRNPNLLKSRYFNLYNTMFEKLSDFMQDQEPIVIVSSQATGLRIYKSNGTSISFSNLTGTSNYGAVFFGYGNDQGGARRGPGSENLIISNTPEMTLFGMGALRNDATTASQSVRSLVDIESEIAKFTNYVGIFDAVKLNTGECSNFCYEINPGAQPSLVTDWTKAPNSYIFTGKDKNGSDMDGLYIPVKKAYAMWKNGKYMGDANDSLLGTQTPSVYWEDVSGLIKSVSIEPGATLEQSRIKIEIDKAKGKGNAVVALHIGNGSTNDNVYWSWHVWVTDLPGVSGEHTTGMDYKYDNITPFVPKFMDRNLGATSNTFLGHEWAKSNGLYYQWGRKDPFPSMTNKDGTYYEISTLKQGNVNNAIYPGTKIQKVNRTSNNIKDNLRYSVGNPLTMMERINLQSGSLDSWFSNSIFEVGNTKQFDLWSDNYEGYTADKIPGEAGFKGYQLKSSYDPCPCNYRIPSITGSSAKSKFSVWGRNSDNNDDATDSILNPNGNSTTNNLFSGIKIYPALGIDFTQIPGRNLGKMSMAGKIYANTSSRSYSSNNFADIASELNSWSASLGFSGARFLGVASDYARLDVNPTFGLNQINHSSGTSSGINTFGMTVRCIEDPNTELIGDFSTDYFSNGQINYTVGIDNPNSYMIPDNQTSRLIPMNKAFAIYNQYLSNHGWPVGSFSTSVVWTSNKTLIKKVSLTGQNENENILVEFGTGNPKGNAVVALKDGQNKVIWSWHIWAPETTPVALEPYTTESIVPNASNMVNPTKSGLPPLTTKFMDRNLGALQTFPDLSVAPTATEAQQIRKSGGMLYQWGRKDPIPAFYNPVNPGGSITGVGDDPFSVYLETGKDANGNSLYALTVDYAAHRSSTYSILYATYSNASNANVSLLEPRHEQIRKVLKYAVENPFKLLYNNSVTTVSGNWQNKIDWISEQSGLFAERWGHGTKKSPFDPCPEGWRVPDVSFPYLMGNTNELPSIKDGQYGSSPWYFGNIFRATLPLTNPTYPRYGLNQSVHYPIGGSNTLKYNGVQIMRNSENKRYGWVFKNAEYNIGNYPATGYRALGNNPNMDQIGFSTGVWTASLGDQLYGRAVALEINISNLKSGIGIIPRGAIPCRCAKIDYDSNGKEIGRYDPEAIPVTTNSKGPAVVSLSAKEINEMVVKDRLVVFPNPVKNILNLDAKNDKDYYYQIYNMSGQLIKKGKFNNKQTDISELPAGVYLIRINNSESVIKIIKQ